MTYERFIRCGSAKPVANYYEAVRPSPAHQYFRPRGWSRLRLVWGLYGAFLVKEFRHAGAPPSSVSLLIRKPFLRTDPRFAHVVARRSCQGWPSHQPSGMLRPCQASSEHDGTLGAVGVAIRGELSFGRGSIAPQPCIRRARGPEP